MQIGKLAVRDLRVLYKIADEGLLHLYCCGVADDKSNPGHKVWFFDDVSEIWEVVDSFDHREAVVD